MTNNKKNGKGGARKGAGRPPMDGKATRVSIYLRVTKENGERLRKIQAQGHKLGMVLDDFIPSIAEKFGIK